MFSLSRYILLLSCISISSHSWGSAAFDSFEKRFVFKKKSSKKQSSQKQKRYQKKLQADLNDWNQKLGLGLVIDWEILGLEDQSFEERRDFLEALYYTPLFSDIFKKPDTTLLIVF